MNEFLDIVLGAVADPVMHAVIHFLWQGSLVALFLAALLILVRPQRSELRYRWACWALVAMVVLPVATAARFAIQEAGPGELTTPISSAADVGDSQARPVPQETTGLVRQLARSVPVAESSSGIAGTILREVAVRVEGPTAARWVLLGWLTGVLLLSITHMGGWLRVQQLRRLQVEAVPDSWQQRADQLCRAMGIRRSVRILRSAAVEVPAVIGWLRPVVLIPASALSGLPTNQLECILAHELAHIWRRDYLVNLLQTCAETLLFFHPAVWWVSQQIRHERENCCDDIAVKLAGDRLLYARSLVDLEELRQASPRLAMGADGGSLLWRVKRLIGGPDMSLHSSRNLLAGTFAALLILVTGSILALAAQATLSDAVAAVTTTEMSGDPIRGRWYAEREDDSLHMELHKKSDDRGRHRGTWSSHETIELDEFTGLELAEDAEFTMRREAGLFVFTGDFEGRAGREEGDGRFTFSADVDFVDGLKRQGTRGLDDDELMVLAMQDLRLETVDSLRELGYGPFDADELITVAIFNVDPEFIDEMEQLGYKDIPLEKLVAMRVHDVDREFIKEMRDADIRTDDEDDLIAWRVHDIHPEYVAEMHEHFGDVDQEKLLAMKIHGVTPEYAEELTRAGIDFDDVDDLVAYRIHGIDHDYIHEMEEHGVHADHEQLLAMKIHGISPAYIKELARAGFENLDGEDLLAWKIHGVNADFIAEVNELGYDLDAEELVAWRIHGVTGEYIDALAELGYRNVDAEDLISLRIHGATPKWIKGLHEKGLDHLDVEDLIKLRISGVRL